MNLRWFAGLVSCLVAPHPAWAEKVFLIIAASSHQPSNIASIAGRLATVVPHGLVVASSDCGDVPRIFGFAAEIAPGRDAAQQQMAAVKRFAPDAYIKACEVKSGSLLALRISAVDPSIANVPKDVVNWTDADRVSTVRQLDPDTFLVIVRRFVDDRNDPLEGRRSRVVLVRTGEKPVTISDTCFDPAHPATTPERIALDCVQEEAGGHLLHGIEVMTRSGHRLVDIPRCNTPVWTDRKTLACNEEEVDASGKLIMRTKTLRID